MLYLAMVQETANEEKRKSKRDPTTHFFWRDTKMRTWPRAKGIYISLGMRACDVGCLRLPSALAIVFLAKPKTPLLQWSPCIQELDIEDRLQWKQHAMIFAMPQFPGEFTSFSFPPGVPAPFNMAYAILTNDKMLSWPEKIQTGVPLLPMLVRAALHRRLASRRGPTKTWHSSALLHTVVPPDIMVIVLGDWYDHWHIENDPPGQRGRLINQRPRQCRPMPELDLDSPGMKPTPHQVG